MHKPTPAPQLSGSDCLTRDLDVLKRKLRNALDRHPPNNKSLAAIQGATLDKRVSGHLPMSNVHVRRAAGDNMINALRWHYRRVSRSPQVRTFLATFTFDDGLIPVDAPELPLYRIERKVRWALNKLGLQGVCVFDIDVLRRPAGEPFRLLLVHVHAVCWTRDPNFSPRKAERSLKSLRRFTNRLGVPSVTIRSRAESSARHRYPRDRPFQDQTAASMEYLGYYLTKPCVALKKRFRLKNGKFSVRKCDKGFGPKLTLLMAYVWSGISPFDAVFAVGAEATAVQARYGKKVRAWARRGGRPDPTIAEAIAAGWRRYFADNSELELTSATVATRRSE